MAAGEENSVCPFLFLKSLEWLCSTPVKKPPVTTTNLDSLSHEDGPSQVAVSRLQLRRRLRPVPNKPQTRDRVITLKKKKQKKAVLLVDYTHQTLVQTPQKRKTSQTKQLATALKKGQRHPC